MGGRSARALKFLRQQGYPQLKNVAGGHVNRGKH